jgi:hypothetical protein
VAIRRSAAAEIEELIAGLVGDDPVPRETAGARLAIIGVRAVPHLIVAFDRTPSPSARAAILKALESAPDRRSAELGAEQLESDGADPTVRAAAVGLLGAYLDTEESTRALDTLTAFSLEEDRPDTLRLHALDAIERALPRVLTPLRERLASDPSPAIRAWASAAAAMGRPEIDPRLAIESAAAGTPVAPALLRELVPAGSAETPLPTLHRLIEVSRTREEEAAAPADRREWQVVRGLVHVALARRSSRVALYDLRETLAGAIEPLPSGFIEAAALAGDASCLEALAEALTRIPLLPDDRDAKWRDGLVGAGRAIVERERLTRRHAIVKKIARLSPEMASALLAPAPR